jgi:hypothetical protein
MPFDSCPSNVRFAISVARSRRPVVGQLQSFGRDWRKVRPGSNPGVDGGRQAFDFGHQLDGHVCGKPPRPLSNSDND